MSGHSLPEVYTRFFHFDMHLLTFYSHSSI
jgi:hypothetical protein